jgi:voltage-gated potassium channel
MSMWSNRSSSGAAAKSWRSRDDRAVPVLATHRRLVVTALLRALTIAAVFVGLYYLAPLDALSRPPTAAMFVGALLVLLAAMVWQVRAVLTSPNPAVRAIEGMAATTPLFLLLFAATYYVQARSHPQSFNVAGLTRTDTLYFTVTVFSTVGFGDITATSQVTRVLVTVQMILDLIAIGLGARVIVGAVRVGRDRNAGSQGARRDEG